MNPHEALAAVKRTIDFLKEEDEYDIANSLEEAVVALIACAAERGEEAIFAENVEGRSN